MTVISKPWGYEDRWASTTQYVGKFLKIQTGQRTSLQYHTEKTETLTVLSGIAYLERETAAGEMERILMQPGKGYTIKPNQRHRVTAKDAARLVEVSTPERGQTVRIEDDYGRADREPVCVS